MKKLKKMIVYLLILIINTTLLFEFKVISAKAETNGEFEYKVKDDGTIEILGYIGNNTTLYIPNTINGIEVTSIGNSAFYHDTYITKVIIADGVKYFEPCAFECCYSLKSITIPDSVTDIGNLCFSQCYDLTYAKLPNNLKEIPYCAFRACEKLKEINLPTDLEIIGWQAFDGCRSLQSINLPPTVSYIAPYGFRSCESLIEIKIPEGVKNISKSSFDNCYKLEKVELPKTLEFIESEAFYGCNNLKNINFPSELKEIKSGAFTRCSSLINIIFPEKLKVIGEWSFSECENLEYVKIPASVNEFTGNISQFYGCNNLKKIEVNENNKNFSDIEGVLVNKNKNSLIAFPGAKDSYYILPESIIKIGRYSFRYLENIKGILIHDSVNYIANDAFANTNITIYGNKGSYAESYANSRNITFKSVDDFYIDKENFNNNFNILNNKYGVIVKDENGINIIGATVTIDDKLVKTNSKGVAEFKNEFNNDSHILKIECNGYYTYKDEDFSINKYKNYENITLYSQDNSPYKLKFAKCSKNGKLTNILNEKVKLSSNDLFNLSCQVISNISEVSKYEIWQNNKKITSSSNGIFLNLTSSLFEANKDISVKVYSKSGEVVTTHLNLEKISEEDMPNLKFSFGGEGESIGIPEEIPYIGGGEINVELPKSLPFEIISDSDGKVKIAINFADCDELNKEYENDYDVEKAWVKFKNNVKAFSQDNSKFRNQNFKNAIKPLKGIAGIESSLEFNVVGYAEGQLTNKGLSNISGELCIKVESSAEIGWQTFIYVIPITIKLSVNSSVEAVGTISYDFNNSTLSSETDLNLAASLEPFVGIGISKVAAVGVFGKAELENTIQIGLKCKIKESVLKGELGIKAYIGSLEYSKSWLNDEYKIYPKNEKSIGSIKSNSSSSSLYDMSNYSLIDRSYLDEKSNWLGNNKLTKFESSLKGTSIENSSNIKSLFKNTFGNSSPKIISSKNDIVMVFIDDDKTRDQYNVGKLVYSNYDKNTDTWSKPIQVDSNNTSDSSPYLYSDGNDIYLIYQDAKKIFTNTIKDNFDEYTKSLGITVAKFNTNTKKFENISTLTTTSNYNSQPKISIIKGVPTAVWISNINGDYFGINNTNNIVYSEFKNGNWTTPKTLAKNLNCITDINVGAINNKFYVAYCMEIDNNLTTINDRILNVVDKNGSTKNLSKGLVSNPIFTVMSDTNLDSLVWYENGNIKVSSNLIDIRALREDGINKLTDDFIILGNKIVYCNSDKDNNSNIYMLRYNNTSKNWSNSIRITNQDKLIKDISVVEIDNKLLATFIQSDVAITENRIDENNNLCYSIINQIDDISLNDVYYEFSDIIPNRNMKIYCEVENKGENTVNNLIVEIKDENNNILQSKEINKTILSSETEKLEVDFLVPSEIKDNDYTITIYEKGKEDNNIEDNSFNFNIGYTDLSISTSQVKKGNKDCILAEVKNESYVNTSGTLNIYGTGSSETPVATKKIDELKAGENKLYYIELGEEYFNDNKKGVVKVSVSSDKEEYYDSNNSDEEYVYYKHKITFVNDDKEYYVTDCMDSTALTSFPDAPIKNGKQFAGWYKDVNCTDGNEFDEKTIINDDITVYAKWIDKIEIESFIADKASPQISGTTVKLSVKAKGNGILKYKFIIKDSKGNWYLLRDYGTSNTYNWTTGAIGDKTLYVDVKDENRQVVRKSMNYIVKEKILAPEISSFIADKASPQVSGTTVKLSVKAKGTGTLQYKFLVKDATGNWFVIQDYSSSNIVVWKTSKTGNKMLYVDVKDSNGQVTRKSMSYIITSPVPTISSFKADKKSPQAIGTKVTLTAKATGEGELQYKFLVKDATGNWFVIQDYSSSNIAVWKASKTGNKMLYVDVKDSNGQVTRKSMNYIVK